MVQNAIQNSRNDGKVKVIMAFDKDEDKIVLIVADNGRGMSQSKQASIFNFTQHVPRERVDGQQPQINLERDA